MGKINLFVFIKFCWIVLAILILAGCGEKQKVEAKKATLPVRVITGETSTRRIEYTLEQVGTLEAMQEVTVRTEIDGKIIELPSTEGKEVTKGTVLARIDATKIEVNIKSLEAQIEQLKVRLDNKLRILERNQPLVKEGLIPPIEYDNLQAEIDEIKAQIVQAHANLTREKVRLDDTTLRAPFSGVVGVRNLSIGDYLKTGDPVVTLVDLDPVQISFQVPEKYKPKLSLGKQVKLTIAPYPDRLFLGIITFSAPQVDVATRTFQVKARVDNGKKLLIPGMFARVEVVTDVVENALTLPWEGVIQTEEGTYFYLVEDGIARKVSAQLGKTTTEWVEIRDTSISNVSAGAKIILEGKYAVKDGMKVSIDGQPDKSTDNN